MFLKLSPTKLSVTLENSSCYSDACRIYLTSIQLKLRYFLR
jgi:hypothetical protein